MEFLMGALALGGIATSLYGTSRTVSAANAAAATSGNIAAAQGGIVTQEEAQAATQYHAFQAQITRGKMQSLRQAQQAAAAVKSNAVNAGAQFGSEPAVGAGSAAAKGATNIQGLLQSAQTGAQEFGEVSQINTLQGYITGQQGNLANEQGQMAVGQGITALGSGITQGSNFFGKLSGFAGSPFGNTGNTGNYPSGGTQPISFLNNPFGYNP